MIKKNEQKKYLFSFYLIRTDVMISTTFFCYWSILNISYVTFLLAIRKVMLSALAATELVDVAPANVENKYE